MVALLFWKVTRAARRLRLNVQAASFAAAAVLLTFSGISQAAEGLESRRIVLVGCHVFDGTCYVTLDGPAFGASLGCQHPGNQARWDNADSANGRRLFAALLAAQLAGKTVAIAVSGCSTQGYPLVIWYHVS